MDFNANEHRRSEQWGPSHHGGGTVHDVGIVMAAMVAVLALGGFAVLTSMLLEADGSGIPPGPATAAETAPPPPRTQAGTHE
jgi:hypothetical protein